MSGRDLLARLAAESEAARLRWAVWGPEMTRGLPPGTVVVNGSVKVVAVVVVPVSDAAEHPRCIVTHHGDGRVERSEVITRTLCSLSDSDGWVTRSELGADPRTDAGRAAITGLMALRRAGHAEMDGRSWWRPTAAGLALLGEQLPGEVSP